MLRQRFDLWSQQAKLEHELRSQEKREDVQLQRQCTDDWLNRLKEEHRISVQRYADDQEVVHKGLNGDYERHVGLLGHYTASFCKIVFSLAGAGCLVWFFQWYLTK